jgi:hypothetical protein
MRQSTGNLILDFVVLCHDRKAFTKIREYEALRDHCLDKAAITAICEYQLSLLLKDFVARGFVGHVV